MPQAAPLLRAFPTPHPATRPSRRPGANTNAGATAMCPPLWSPAGISCGPTARFQWAADIAWSAIISPQVADMLMDGRGWTMDEYVDWAVETFDLLFLG